MPPDAARIWLCLAGSLGQGLSSLPVIHSPGCGVQLNWQRMEQWSLVQGAGLNKVRVQLLTFLKPSSYYCTSVVVMVEQPIRVLE